MEVVSGFPSQADVVLIGAGFAGAATAAALARAGMTGGLLLERERQPGVHASGRNAAIARQLERHPALLSLAVDGVRRLGSHMVDGRPVLDRTGGIYLFQGTPDDANGLLAGLHGHGVPSGLLLPADACVQFPFLRGFDFQYAIWCPADGIVDIHALLSGLLAEAGEGRIALVTDCAVESIVLENSRVAGVRTTHGEVRTCLVVDASGAWAGHLGRAGSPLPLKPLRRHLFVGEAGEGAEAPRRSAPFVWDLDAGYYLRPEGLGLLLCACDETEHAPGVPAVDPAAAELLADKLLRFSPGLGDVAVRRAWACLRTFAPDRLPVIGWDDEISGLFHVSGLGGFGATTCLAAGDLAATLIRGGTPEWIHTSEFSPKRAAMMPGQAVPQRGAP